MKRTERENEKGERKKSDKEKKERKKREEEEMIHSKERNRQTNLRKRGLFFL